jgi:uncharacterized protein YjeT (DUF2065 family)
VAVSGEAIGEGLRQLELEISLVYGVYAMIVLAPFVLTVFPAIVRAGFHAKRLVPESPLPGWVVIVSPPLYILCTSSFFAIINQIGGHLALLGGITLTLAGPLVYPFASRRLARSVDEENLTPRLRRIRLAGDASVVVGTVLIGIFLSENPYIVQSGLLTPVRLGELGVDFVTHYLLTTILATDYVVGLLIAIRAQEVRNREKAPALREQAEKRLDGLIGVGRA